MEFDVWIEEHDRNLVHDLFGVDYLDYNKVYVEKHKKMICEGVTFHYKHSYACDAENISSWMIITMEIGREVALPIALGVISNFIYDKLKDRKNQRIAINNQIVQLDAKQIEQAILTNYIPTKEEEKEE